MIARHEEIIKPDLVVGFAQLAPFVTAANAHLKHGAIDDAKKCLEQACKVIELATMTVIFSPIKEVGDVEVTC